MQTAHSKAPKFGMKLFPTEQNGQYSAIDLFCGSGGVTEGFQVTNEIKVVAAVNHSPEAIEAHKKNNPEVLHFMEDIREVEKILPHLPSKVNILWASAECTNHSNAKGGQSREADSRSLPEYLGSYVSHTNPDAFFVENVREFMDWGPLIHKRNKHGKFMYDKKGKAIYCTDKTRKGRHYNRWVNSIKKLGYQYDKRLLNAADYGVHTSRTRYFGLFVKNEYCIMFPEPTHSKNPEKTGLEGWKPCRDKINLDLEGESIFGRGLNMNIRPNLRKPLADKSQARCAYGIRKFFLSDFISKNFNTKHNVSSLDEPLHNIDTRDRHMKIKLNLKFITQNIQCSLNANSLDEPLKTILTQDEKIIVTLSTENKFILKKYSGKHQVGDVNDPYHSIVTNPQDKVISLNTGTNRNFILKKQAGEKNVGDLDKPYHTILTEPVDQLVTLKGDEDKFILKKYTGPSNVGSVNEPYHSIMTKPDDALISIKQGGNDGAALSDFERLRNEEKRAFFFQYFEPDEAELLDLLITDIKARYLTSYELADISGFKPETYLGKSETIRKKHIGNAVPPWMSAVLSMAFINGNRPAEMEMAI